MWHLFMVDLTVLGQQLEFMILRVFYNLNDSMILLYISRE